MYDELNKHIPTPETNLPILPKRSDSIENTTNHITLHSTNNSSPVISNLVS